MKRQNQSSESLQEETNQSMTEGRRLSLSSPHSQSSSQLKIHKSVNVSIDQSLSKSVNLTSFQDNKLNTKKIPLGGSRDNSMTRRSKMLTQSGTASQIKVIVRFRPFNEKELRELPHKFQQIINIPEKQAKTCYVYSDLQQTQSYLSFTLDHIFTPETKQSEVFDFIGKGSIEDVLNGYNSTVFAYGQTGSGKTFTMMGSSIFNPEGKGLIPRISEHIFSFIQEKGENDIEFTVICSMVEIYQEKLYDLLDSNSDKMLIIKESPLKGIYIDQLAEISVVDEEEILEVIQMGEKLRTVSSTSMNKKSSRSHILFILEIRQKHSDDTEKIGKLNLIDLAGSEKVKKSKASGITLEEAKKINLSLSALGNVIHSLTSNADHIPYRDSKLTRLLQESLGGNYKTTLLIACSPHINNIQETISTLQFAARAKTIKNCVKVNMKLSTAQLQQIIQELQKELLATKIELEKYKANFTETSQIYEVTNMTCFTETPPNISAYKVASPQMQQLPPSSSKQLERRRKQLSDLVINLNESSLDSSLMESSKVETTKNTQQQTEESFISRTATNRSVQLQTDEPIINKEEVVTRSQQQIEVQLSPKPKITHNFQQQTEDLSSSRDQTNKRRQLSTEKPLNNKYQARYNQKKVQESHFNKSKSTQNLQQQAEKIETIQKEMKSVQQQTETSWIQKERVTKNNQEMLSKKLQLLESKISEQEQTIEVLQENKKETEIKQQYQVDQIQELKKQILVEQEENNKTKSNIRQEEISKDHINKKMQLLTTQVNTLTEQLQQCDQNYFKNLNESSQMLIQEGKLNFGAVDLPLLLKKLSEPENQNAQYAQIAIECVRSTEIPIGENLQISKNQKVQNEQEPNYYKGLLFEAGFHNTLMRRIIASLQ